jgi:hypothetical protein
VAKKSKGFVSIILIFLILIIGFQFIFNGFLLHKNEVLKNTLKLERTNVATIRLYEFILNDVELLRLQKFNYETGKTDEFARGFNQGQLATYERIAKILLKDP